MIKHFKWHSQTKRHQRTLIAIFSLLILLLIIGILRINDFFWLRYETKDQSILTVNTIKAAHGPADEIIILPGNVQAWHETIIYARTNGYVKTWLVDIGDKVKRDQLLALIASPEVDEELRQAEANLKTAEANYQLALITSKRWLDLSKTDSVSKQETDEKISALKASQADVLAARANRDKLRDLVSFERVIAPFDGIITERNTDVGELINAGGNTIPLFHIAQANPLRIYVNIPQNYAQRITKNVKATLYFNDYPDKSFPAKLFQTADAIDPVTRTLLAQFTIENASYALLPGSYTEVHLIVSSPSECVRLPVNTLLFRAEGLQVAVVDDKNQVVLKSIVINRDFGNEVEINSGIKPGDLVILNPADSLIAGQKVRIVNKGGVNDKKQT